MHKILMCGDRNWTDETFILDSLMSYLIERPIGEVTLVIHGNARGADQISGRCASTMGLAVVAFPANWNQYGRAAGPIRNRQMLEQHPNIVLAFHDNIEESKGTKDMVSQARLAGVETRVLTHA